MTLPGDPFVLGLVTAGLSALLAVIAWTDAKTLRIPDRWSLPLLGAGLMLSGVLPEPGLTDRVIGAAAGYLALALLGEAWFRWRGVEGLGLGDAKLFGAAGAWLGWQALPGVLVVASGVGLAVAVLTLRRGAAMAFGPMLCLAFWLFWMLTIYGGALT